MKLLIISALVVIVTAGTVPDVQKSIILPEPPVPKDETAYVPRPEPISFGMIMVPQEVLDAVAAEQNAEIPEPIDTDNAVKVVDSVAEPAKVEGFQFEPISAGELETIRVMVPETVQPLNEAESVRVVDVPIESQTNEETIVHPVRIIDASVPDIRAQYPHLRFPDPYLR